MGELRIIICPKSEGSAGLREYLNNNYSWIKTLNLNLPISVRSGETAQAHIYCRYDYNKTEHLSCEFLSAKDIEDGIKKFSKKGESLEKSYNESVWKNPQIIYSKQSGRLMF